MIVIGLTGSIGMGKSTVGRQFALLGAKVASADAFVHQLMEQDKKLIAEVEKNFPSAIINQKIDRQKLGKVVFSDSEKRKILEHIIHPKVVELEEKFVRRQKLLGTKLLVLDIPLLFETVAEGRVDYTIVVTAPAFIQRQRVLKRKNMTQEKFEKIVASQMPDYEKRLRADFIIDTGLGKAHSFKQSKKISTYINHQSQ